jgi:endogenous inhibitor of DNA gyrase (YacG/DUF329 family)
MTVQHKCYECKTPIDLTAEEFPFCSGECHQQWADREYGPQEEVTDIAAKQRQLLRMGKEVGMKKGANAAR